MLSIIEKVLFLQNIDVFDQVPSELLAMLAAITTDIKIPKDSTIYNINDHSDAMYLVLSGSVKLHIDNREISTAKSKDAFGTWALFDDSPRVVTAVTLEDTHLLKIDREEFVDLLADNVRITQAIMKTLVQRMRNLVNRIDISSNK
ncbi:MAG: cyclic nucleotide-binding domain-containing protein [Calditrichaeota bacterium]|nr:MAG: cyclic nucleotide-binding domain-containing protein [Calditrichota bacterium]